jgi:hypothetical protein
VNAVLNSASNKCSPTDTTGVPVFGAPETAHMGYRDLPVDNGRPCTRL